MQYNQYVLNIQEDIINDINDAANRIQNSVVNIKDEINEQENKITKLGVDIGKTEKKLNFVQSKLRDLLKTNGIIGQYAILEQSQICTILILFGTLCALIFLLFFT
ncbi:unnamed protein product (macronuclear) [Paramecium tetraurelia]|uniref:t-SNARE coiled-coil homology domain-containing protein n=1 Tax=Paramecium tetraurelia TaxID=5888 RepID=A0E270_PARTE|nr:uncharacterized protein GSPATT00022559001 [Paramecium tetraurelia]CAK89387.1 unnamed protein product [Paramecium tetraurelia]|eukprot:XP_001456784.1 hypothetical protein (macronuclear) [Paramecium tetraurelia strain d4-2]